MAEFWEVTHWYCQGRNGMGSNRQGSQGLDRGYTEESYMIWWVKFNVFDDDRMDMSCRLEKNLMRVV